MSADPSDLPNDDEEEDARTWGDRLADLAASAQSLLSTRLAIFREELAEKAALLGRGLAAIAIAAGMAIATLLLLAALLVAVFAKLFGSVILGILAAVVLFAAGLGGAGYYAFKSLSRVKPDEFTATAKELSRDWEAIRTSFTAEPVFDDGEAAAAGAADGPNPVEVESLEARLRGGTD